MSIPGKKWHNRQMPRQAKNKYRKECPVISPFVNYPVNILSFYFFFTPFPYTNIMQPPKPALETNGFMLYA